MDCSTPGFPVLHHLLEPAQNHIHQVGDAIQHLVLCGLLFLLPSIFPSISVFSNIYWLYLGLFTYIHIYVYVLCICIYVYIHIHKYICVHTHTYIVYIHTYILHQGLFTFISQLQDLFTYILGTNSVSQPKARNWSHLWIDSKI